MIHIPFDKVITKNGKVVFMLLVFFVEVGFSTLRYNVPTSFCRLFFAPVACEIVLLFLF